VPLPNPVIVVPGVTATYLRDLYPVSPESVWTVVGKDFGRTQLHPDSDRFEALQPAMIRPGQIYEIVYKELMEELRYSLSETPDRPVPVFPFGYDWRQPLGPVEEALDAFIDEVIARTKLLRHYHHDGYAGTPRVNLVGHSMGGLVVAGYIERFGAGKIDRVATLASPFRGSFEAIVKMVTGTANIGGAQPSSREREAARVTPSLYHLLPDFDTGIALAPDIGPDSGSHRSTFDPGLWQSSIIDTIAGYAARHGVDPGVSQTERGRQGTDLFARMLDTARGHRARMSSLRLFEREFDPRRWLCVIGAGCRTRVRMTVDTSNGDPVFRLTSEDREEGWNERDPEARMLTGDGTVHFKGAVPAFLPLSLAALYLQGLKRVDGDPARYEARPPGIRRQLTVLWRSMLGRP